MGNHALSLNRKSSVRDLFKHVGRGNYVWFSVDERKWRSADGKKFGGRDQLIHVISTVLNRHLGERWLSEFGGHEDLDAIVIPCRV